MMMDDGKPTLWEHYMYHENTIRDPWFAYGPDRSHSNLREPQSKEIVIDGDDPNTLQTTKANPTINCGDNVVESVKISNLPRVNKLIVSNNPNLSNLIISNCPELQEVYHSGTPKLHNVIINNCPNLINEEIKEIAKLTKRREKIRPLLIGITIIFLVVAIFLLIKKSRKKLNKKNCKQNN